MLKGVKSIYFSYTFYKSIYIRNETAHRVIINQYHAHDNNLKSL
jgi:hypothetical protein